MDVKETFESNLQLIEQVCDAVCRRNGCFGADAEDFTSQVMIELMEDDYSRLRRFCGRSSLKAFLRATILNLFRDYRNQKWGRWRPSAEAQRQGPLARHLDQLLHRDGYSFDVAVGILRTNLKVTTPLEELTALADKLPTRTRRRFETDEQLAEMPVDGEVDGSLLDEEKAETAKMTQLALRKAKSELPAQDRLILKMRFEDGFTVTRIAAVLKVKRRQLYSQVEKCLKRLRSALEEEGLKGEDVLGLLGWDGPESEWPAEGKSPLTPV